MDESPSIRSVITSYHELNPTVLDELAEQPTALDFMRYVSTNRGFIVRRGAKDWDALRKWDAAYLRDAMKGRDVKVAVTPHGNADAVVADEAGRLLFVEPYEVNEPFETFLSVVQEDSRSQDRSRGRNVRYAQTQNGNLPFEYANLAGDVPTHIAFATEALGQDPDAVNFWLGNDRSTTSLHKDNYENIYVQVRGQKHFILLPPIEMPCVNESPLSFARYRPTEDDGEDLVVETNKDIGPTPVPLWDPDEPELRPTVYSKYSKPLKVTLNEGDMMYLPAMWYHKVGQGNGDEGFACSVNYWYDMDFSGSFWSSNAFVRDVYNASLTSVSYPALDMQDE
ncbi:hypothetical protein M409DRAFT_56113 [Zasmidium cellare ATCC 36951]|uniref:JmjC domain-containing protein n=1 Tax=Zasmidium cellare ATCC 36951 TaxID=1080233 RepID=A0A6A6CDT6_ZASCE|nr:uncharacterized protein M409DRAFT_56113 [Zasmidium cellare ATCC 36951]KAF2165241.1 hypothetical protein M409DRAFT_56113 [Zasmidium cellare ATCC 36951]